MLGVCQKVMKIVACMIAFNGMPFFPAAVDAIAPYVDCMLICYGPQQEFMHISPDDTAHIIWNIDHKYKNTQFYTTERMWKSETEQRNAYLQLIRDEIPDCDWLWVIDSDEFYLPQDIQFLKTMMKIARDNTTHILYPFMNFYHDFHHYQMNYNGMLKLIRWHPDLEYHEQVPQVLDNIGDRTHNTLWDTPSEYYQNVKCFHYCHLAYNDYWRKREIDKLIGSNLRDSGNPQKPNFKLLTPTEQRLWISNNYWWLWHPSNEHSLYTDAHPQSVYEIMEKYK